MEKIKTFEDVCTVLGLDPKKKYPASEKPEMIVAAIIGKWKADYTNPDQLKWFVYMVYDASVSAFRFFGSYFRYAGAGAGTGVRLAFETEAQANYAGKQFEKEFSDALLETNKYQAKLLKSKS